MNCDYYSRGWLSRDTDEFSPVSRSKDFSDPSKMTDLIRMGNVRPKLKSRSSSTTVAVKNSQGPAYDGHTSTYDT